VLTGSKEREKYIRTHNADIFFSFGCWNEVLYKGRDNVFRQLCLQGG